ncbi:hypothetical protein ACFO4O_05520 [Glaciecola siphonariae]|uniref:Uncharacterized protein n=1 Tax=Glaciecola siphonariae TaxID=521012 RepID=A0ABV9LUJ8_9ALTE
MSDLTTASNLSTQHAHTSPILTLVLDEHTDVAMSDRPIFGTTVTIRDDIEDLIGHVLQAGLIIGWLNYIDMAKFACLSDNKHYREAGVYFKAESNQLMLAKSIMLHGVDRNMSHSKHLFTFSARQSKVCAINANRTSHQNS